MSITPNDKLKQIGQIPKSGVYDGKSALGQTEARPVSHVSCLATLQSIASAAFSLGLPRIAPDSVAKTLTE